MVEKVKEKKKLTPEQKIYKEIFRELEIPERPKDETDLPTMIEYYNKFKNVMMAFEVWNRGYIAFYHRDKTWWEAGNNSALLYIYEASERFGDRGKQVKPDLDTYKEKWRDGCTRTSDIKGVEVKLARIGFKKVLDIENRLVVFKADREYLDTEFADWAGRAERANAEFDRVLMPSGNYAELLNNLRMLVLELEPKAQKMSRVRYELLMKEGTEVAIRLFRGLIKVATGEIDRDTYFNNAEVLMKSFNSWLVYAVKMGALSPQTGLRVVEKFDIVKREIEKVRRQIENAKE